MQRIGQLTDWRYLEAGKMVEFNANRVRRVRLHVNAPDETKLYVVKPDGETAFLALVRGLDVVEFVVGGSFAILAEGAGLNWFSQEGTNRHAVVPDPAVFTRIHERREKNYEVLLMERVMRQNMEKRMAKQMAEMERRLSEREAAANAALDKRTASAGADSAKPKQGAGRKASDPSTEQVAPGDGGTETGDGSDA